MRARIATILLAGLTAATASGSGASAQEPPGPAPHVVVATLDTGTNPFHPSFRRDQFAHPSTFIPGYPASAESVQLTFRDSFSASVSASKAALAMFKQKNFPYWIPGTNIIGTWAAQDDGTPIFQSGSTSHSHGAQASSQIAGTGFGLAPETWLVIMDRTPDPAATDRVYLANGEGLRWAADQPWIDIIHTNIHNLVPLAGNPTPVWDGAYQAALYAMSKGKLLVSAGGNWYVEPTETSPHAGPPGVLAAGANDNCGYTEFSNPNPHVVMDGASTVSAAPSGYGEASFGGTSSASPRTTGYTAQLLLQIRRHFGYAGGIQEGALVVLAEGARPSQGPLADGRLTAAELHEVVRKTADPNPHASMWDGGQSLTCIPQPQDYPYAFYPKMGYGEISEHTFQAAFDVTIGAAAMPARPVEDEFFNASQAA